MFHSDFRQHERIVELERENKELRGDIAELTDAIARFRAEYGKRDLAAQLRDAQRTIEQLREALGGQGVPSRAERLRVCTHEVDLKALIGNEPLFGMPDAPATTRG